MGNQLFCHRCGELFDIDATGVSTHLTADGETDYDADADHVPYTLEEQQ